MEDLNQILTAAPIREAASPLCSSLMRQGDLSSHVLIVLVTQALTAAAGSHKEQQRVFRRKDHRWDPSRERPCHL